MPPDVRRQYEKALELLKNVEQGGAAKGSLKKNVKTFPGGVSINVEQRKVQYTIDGKTYDDPAQVPPGIRGLVDKALAGASQLELGQGVRSEVRIERPPEVRVQVDIERRGGMGRILVWLLIAAGVALGLLVRWYD
jgi:hypothetical protein